MQYARKDHLRGKVHPDLVSLAAFKTLSLVPSQQGSRRKPFRFFDLEHRKTSSLKLVSTFLLIADQILSPEHTHIWTTNDIFPGLSTWVGASVACLPRTE